MTNALSGGQQVSGAMGATDATLIPNNFIQELRPRRPIPITISGTSNRTFTLNASKTNPVYLPCGKEYIELRETKAFSWLTTANNTLNSTGAEASLTGSTVGVWYYYLSVSKNWSTKAVTVEILPSLTAPSYIEATRYNAGSWGHPGTATAKFWVYVGWHICSATTPTFTYAEKSGYDYMLANQDVSQSPTVAGGTPGTAVDFQNVLPATEPEVSGYVTMAITKAFKLDIFSQATSTGGALGKWSLKSNGTVAEIFPIHNLRMNATPSTAFWTSHSNTCAVTISITQVKDWV